MYVHVIAGQSSSGQGTAGKTVTIAGEKESKVESLTFQKGAALQTWLDSKMSSSNWSLKVNSNFYMNQSSEAVTRHFLIYVQFVCISKLLLKFTVGSEKK